MSLKPRQNNEAGEDSRFPFGLLYHSIAADDKYGLIESKPSSFCITLLLNACDFSVFQTGFLDDLGVVRLGKAGAARKQTQDERQMLKPKYPRLLLL